MYKKKELAEAKYGIRVSALSNFSLLAMKLKFIIKSITHHYTVKRFKIISLRFVIISLLAAIYGGLDDQAACCIGSSTR